MCIDDGRVVSNFVAQVCTSSQGLNITRVLIFYEECRHTVVELLVPIFKESSTIVYPFNSRPSRSDFLQPLPQRHWQL